MTVTSPTERRAVLADTGPLFAAADPKDQYHLRTQRDIERLEREGRQVLVPYPIVCECHALLVRRRGPSLATRWLIDVQANGISVTPGPDDYLAAMQRLIGYGDQPITLFDALLAVMSEQLHLPVWTFDHHFDVMRVAVWR